MRSRPHVRRAREADGVAMLEDGFKPVGNRPIGKSGHVVNVEIDPGTTDQLDRVHGAEVAREDVLADVDISVTECPSIQPATLGARHEAVTRRASEREQTPETRPRTGGGFDQLLG